MLEELYPTEVVKDHSKSPHMCDIELERENKSKILFEVKYYKRSVDKEGVKKFIDNIEQQNDSNLCGIMISLGSGICRKQDFQLDIVGSNRNVVIYLTNHSNKNSLEDTDLMKSRILQAINIVDSANDIFKQYKQRGISLTSKQVEGIRGEFTSCISTITRTLEHVRESASMTKKLLESIKFTHLHNFLQLHNEIIETEKQLYSCENCKNYTACSKTGYSSHYTKCIKKFPPNISTIEDPLEDISSEQTLLGNIISTGLTGNIETFAPPQSDNLIPTPLGKKPRKAIVKKN
jgi:hypothetical protein